MILRLFSFLFIISLNFACSKNDKIDLEKSKANPYEIYKEAIQSFERNDFFLNKNLKRQKLILKLLSMQANQQLWDVIHYMQLIFILKLKVA